MIQIDRHRYIRSNWFFTSIQWRMFLAVARTLSHWSLSSSSSSAHIMYVQVGWPWSQVQELHPSLKVARDDPTWHRSSTPWHETNFSLSALPMKEKKKQKRKRSIARHIARQTVWRTNGTMTYCERDWIIMCGVVLNNLADIKLSVFHSLSCTMSIDLFQCDRLELGLWVPHSHILRPNKVIIASRIIYNVLHNYIIGTPNFPWYFNCKSLSYKSEAVRYVYIIITHHVLGD